MKMSLASPLPLHEIICLYSLFLHVYFTIYNPCQREMSLNSLITRLKQKPTTTLLNNWSTPDTFALLRKMLPLSIRSREYHLDASEAASYCSLQSSSLHSPKKESGMKESSGNPLQGSMFCNIAFPEERAVDEK